MRISNLWWAVLPFCLFACNKDEQQEGTDGTPVSFVTTISPSSRLTVNNSWAGLSDAKVGVEINGTVKEYTVNEKGELTSAAPFYWEDLGQTVSVNAWYPYNEGKKPEVVVAADQSVAANYLASDLLEVNNASVSASENTLTFVHRTACVECALQLNPTEEGTMNAATITLCNLSGVAEGNSVKTTGDYKALVAPQTLTAGTVFMEVTMSDGRSDEYVLPEDVELKQGYIFPVSVEVTPDGLQVAFGTPIKWEGETVGTNGEAPEVGPGANGDNWESNGSDTTTGDSSEVGPDGNANGWTEGDNETTTGGSSTVNPDGNSSNWGGNSETTTGGSSTINPDGNSSNWGGNSETTTGGSSTVNPGGNSSSWGGSSDTTTGSSSTVNPGNSSGATWGGENNSTPVTAGQRNEQSTE